MFVSRFLILILINLPIVLIGTVGAIVAYKTKQTSKKRCLVEVISWIIVGFGLVMVEPAYNLLVKNNLTTSDSMSIFDIILLTLVLICGLFLVKSNEKISSINNKLSRIHEHIAMKDAEDNKS